MASISKIRYTNVIYENGGKRYNDEIFTCAGHNTAILLENGGGKTVFIQAALQAVLPHTDLGERKAKETFVLEGQAAHIAIEWIISDKPRRYGLTAVTLYLQNNELRSHKFAYAYGVEDKNTIENLPFTREEENGGVRAATRVEMNEYYQRMSKENLEAKSFATTKDFHRYIEEQFKIIPEEWRSITVINGGEGSVEAFFDGCKTTSDLVEKLLLPTVEQGLVGEGSDEFANTFESQRAHFNKHKQLERSIKESEKIKGEIETYVACYDAYHQTLNAYETKKEEAKAIWQLIEEREAKVKASLEALDEEKKEMESSKREVEKESALIEVSEAKMDLDTVFMTHEMQSQSFSVLKEKKEEKETRRHILKLSRFQNNMKEAAAKVKLYEEQLALLDEDTEVEDLKEALEVNSGQIKGYFMQRLEVLRKEQGHCEREKERYQEEEQSYQKEKAVLQQKLQQLRSEMSKLAGQLEQKQKQMDYIKMQIIAEVGHGDLEGQSKKWQERLNEIDTNKVTLRQNLRIQEETQKTLSHEIEAQTEKRTKVLSDLGQVIAKVHQLEKEQEKVLRELQTTLPMFSGLSSIYLKPQQVITTLEELIEKVTREKEDALLLERRHAHFLENYANHDFFTAEPLLEMWVEKWAGQFEFLQTGTAFIESLEDVNLKMQMYHKPKWTQLVIVSDGREADLKALIEAQKGQMTYPVGVIGHSQAHALLQEGEMTEQLIYPSSWIEHMQMPLFEDYKKEAGKALEEATTFRKQKEEELRKVDQVLEKVSSFLEEYTHEIYAKLREEHSQLKKQEAEMGRQIEKLKLERVQLEKENKQAQETLRKEADEKNRLQGYIEKVANYTGLKEESERDQTKVSDLQEVIGECEKQLDQIERRLMNCLEALEEAKETLGMLRSSENRIKDDPLYKEVKEERTIDTTEDIAYLRSKQEQLKESLSNKQRGRSEIEMLLRQSQKTYEENEESYRQEQADREVPLEAIPSYEEGYAIEIDRLTEELKGIRQELEALESKVKEAKTNFDKKEQDYQSKYAAYEERYGVVNDFVSDYKEAKERLEKEQSTMSEKEKYLMKQIQGLEKELKVILEHKQQMDKKDELYGYCAPQVKVGLLEEAIQQEIMYELKLRIIVGTLLEDLAQLKEKVEQSKKAVEEQKLDFKLFCQKEITDSKLRNMALQGIMQKQDYEELVVWTDNIVERINQTLTILERDLLDQDQQISQFIIHLYAYLKTVATELGEIPKKTRVNTEEGWKTIYEFAIPSWQEESGKEKIRMHIYSLLDDMESEHFLDDAGKEDTQKIKKYIKEQFKLRTLLKVVMGNDAIRVRCRKVSNISDISSQKYSWETSNKWSGGEKWSKNMALYLGILNYLAEKKQNIQGEDQKVSRAVILDNPFGKASSGHVLEPVFFIAKQLGFQMIALTAHSEGDFIRRYFPVVYSCKLRNTLDQRTSIFTKEQEIKKAYFVDNDPVALSILGSNQIGLF